MRRRCLFVTALSLAGCQTRVDVTPFPYAAGTGTGLFLHGCPTAGRSAARELVDVAEAPWGPDALAAPGDVLLVNSHAAFVIQGPDDPRTYYHYGGTPIDAVAVDGCEQAGPEILGEAGYVIGQLDLADFETSTLHMFRGDSVEIVADGSDGGAAVVEVHGTDDRFWLIELTLMRRVFEGGGRKELGDLYGLDITVRYTLEPGDSALQVDVELGGQPITDGFLVGAVVFPSDYTETTAWASGSLSLGGVALDTGVPWMASGSATGSTAIAMPGAAMARTEIAGVTALIDVNQSAVPLVVADGGANTAFALSVGATDAASAAAGLEPHLADPVPGVETTWADLGGVVRDPAGAGAAGADVDLACPDAEGTSAVVTTFVTGADGAFAGRSLTTTGCTLQARQDGRDAGSAVTASTGAALDIGARGQVAVVAVDDAGAAISARVELERDDGTVLVAYATPSAPDLDVPPGHWTAWVTRGYEYEPVTASIDVPSDGSVELSATLAHVIDTAGWASMDSHVHCGPSPDSAVLPGTRMKTVAGSGLDVMISTDHEAIVDLSAAVTAEGLDDELLYVLGSEVTASLPEHTNAWPFPVVDGGRGDPVRWYQLGFPGIYAAERERGAQVIQLNHARVNGECGILCILDWDRMGDDPTMDDPAAIGLDAYTPIWSWDFDSFEVLNGERSPYLDPEDPRHSGALYDWFAFYNLGHRPTGVGVTDEHGMDTPGTPRTYVAVADDAIGGFTQDELATGVLDGNAQISSGAFTRVTLDGAGPGELATITDGEGELAVNVQALEGIDVTRVDVVVNCDPGVSLAATAPDSVVKLDTSQPLELPTGSDSYVVVVAIGEGAMPRGLTDYDAGAVPRSITNPILVDGDGDGVYSGPGAKGCGWGP